MVSDERRDDLLALGAAYLKGSLTGDEDALRVLLRTAYAGDIAAGLCLHVVDAWHAWTGNAPLEGLLEQLDRYLTGRVGGGVDGHR